MEKQTGVRTLVSSLVFYGYCIVLSLQTTPAHLEVHFTNLRNSNGQILVSLYHTKDGFPSDSKKALKNTTVRAQQNNTKLVFYDLPPGNYALACVHDENNDGKLNTNFIGLPIEGYGASNNATALMGPPKFEAAQVKVPAGLTKISIRMKY